MGDIPFETERKPGKPKLRLRVNIERIRSGSNFKTPEKKRIRTRDKKLVFLKPGSGSEQIRSGSATW